MTTKSATLPARTVATPSLMGQRQFRAMNTKVELFVSDLEQTRLFGAAEEVFHTMEARLSRFLPDSELCHLNERSGQETQVSSVLFDILLQAQRFNRLTGGAFEPAMLSELEAAGYDRSFERVELWSGDRPSGAVAPEAFSISQVRLDTEKRSVRVPAGLRIDLGGIGKGYTADAAARVMQPARDFVVNAGGDLFASGSGPDGDGWLVNLTDPTGAADGIALIRLYDEALATSTTAVRRWHRGERLFHHLIDPRTRLPAESGVLSVSVVAKTATRADVFAKVALLLGPDDGTRFLRKHDAYGLFVMNDGRLLNTPGWSGTQQN
jgi:thiamine biosynthesis lipoprotein